MWISQAQAIDKLKAETGLNGSTCEREIRRMPKRQDGKRMKVHTMSLQELIDFTNKIKRDAVDADVVKLTRRTRARIRASR